MIDHRISSHQVFYVRLRQPVSFTMQELATETPIEVLLALQSVFIEGLSHHASGPVQEVTSTFQVVAAHQPERGQLITLYLYYFDRQIKVLPPFDQSLLFETCAAAVVSL